MLSPATVNYLEQLNKESLEGFWEDGGLIIAGTNLVDRLIWWGNFRKENPKFLFKTTPRLTENAYLSSLVGG